MTLSGARKCYIMEENNRSDGRPIMELVGCGPNVLWKTAHCTKIK